MTEKTRDEKLRECENEKFDMLIIGGGITGSGVARDATLRGLKCILLEKGDFGSGTSSKSSKLIHGGLRYLRYFNFRLVIEGCRERYRLLNNVAPHIVRAIRFVFPFYRGLKNSRWFVAMGLFLYSALASFRNIHLFRFISLKKLLNEEPALRKEDCVGGLSYYDCKCNDSRLVIDTMKSAAERGAALFNYCEVTAIDFEDNGIRVHAVDRLTGKDYKLAARMAVNAAGAWADDILHKCTDSEKFNLKMATGIHLIIPKEKLPVNNTMLVEVPLDGRGAFFIPWGENILVGTTDKFFEGDKDRIPVRPDSIDYLLETVNYYYPGARLARGDVKSVYAGVRSLVEGDSGMSEEELPRDELILTDGRGLVSITGGKLTTYRATAKKTVDIAVASFFSDRSLKSCETISHISGGDMAEVRRIKSGNYDFVKSAQVEQLCERYGSNAAAIIDYFKTDPGLSSPIHPDVPYCRGELKYFVDNEFCEKLTDVMFRRSELYLFGENNGLPAAYEIAQYIGNLKGWDKERVDEEVRLYREWVEFLFKDLSKG